MTRYGSGCALRGRPDTDGRYAQFLALRFGVGINFVAVRTNDAGEVTFGYTGFRRDSNSAVRGLIPEFDHLGDRFSSKSR